MNTRKAPLVIMGFDAARPDLLLKGARDGSLHALHSIMKEGAWGMIRGREMIFEHGFWPSIMSGVSRKDHGYFYFRQMMPGTYNLKTMSGKDSGVSPFWARFTGSEARIAIFDVPDIFPVPGLDGIQLSDLAVHNPVFAPQTYPHALLPEVNKVFGKRLRIREIIESTVEQDHVIYGQLCDQLKRKGEMIRHFLSKGEFDLIVCFFSESHVATHQFWKYSSEASEEFRTDPDGVLQDATFNVYRFIDEEIRQIRAMLPEDSNTLVISSSGMQDQFPCTELIDSFCTRLGYRVPKKSEERPKRGMDLLRNVVPEQWRIQLSKLLLSREQRERLLSDQFKNYTDWENTRAFATPSIYSGFIRVNLRGREPRGIVPPAEYDSLLKELENDLMLLSEPGAGGSVVQKVLRTGELFGTGPHASLPDLVVQWKPIPHLLRTVNHPKCVLTQSRPEFFRGSDHTDEGFVAMSGPGVRKRGVMPDLCVLDLVPTFLELMGESAPAALAR